MKTFFATLSLMVLLALSGAAQTTKPARPTPGVASAAEKQTFTALMTQVGVAAQARDTATLSRLFATEYRHYTPDYQISTHKSELAFISSKEWPFTTVALGGPVAVNVYGSTAVTVANVRFGGQEKTGQAFASTLQMMAVWVQRDGHWQIAVLQSKELPAKQTAKD